ncbi:MAG TPA: hypothetical protein VG735_14750 [Caulobacterales bacterium]|nr:hypothetical protein [Caulobacterales bacterium]
MFDSSIDYSDNGGEPEEEDNDELAKVNAAIKAEIKLTCGAVRADSYGLSMALHDAFASLAAGIADKLEIGGEVVDYDSNDEPSRIATFSNEERQRLEEVKGLFEIWSGLALEMNEGLSDLDEGRTPSSYLGAW